MRILSSFRVLAAAVLLMGAAPPVQLADPVAVLVQMRGDVRVQRDGEPAPKAGAVGAQLQEGDAVLVADGARATLLYRTGKVVTASQTVRVVAETGQPSTMFAQATQTLAQIATTDARTQPNRQGMIRPLGGTAVPISPRNGIPVLSLRPTFTWYRIPDVGGYLVQITPERGAPLRLVAGSDTTWTLPDSMMLSPGTRYTWTVGAAEQGRVAPAQAFRSATEDERRALRQAFDEIESAGLDPEGSGLFLAALAYHRGGFLYDAERALDRLAATGGGGWAFHSLRGQVYDGLGRLDEAAREFSLADDALGR